MLLHLLECGSGEDSAEVPRDRTQSGLADAAGIHVKHVPQYVRPLLQKGYVRERSSHVAGGRQRRKAYFLTLPGRKEATRIRTAFLDEEVTLESPEGRKTMTLREASRDHLGRAALPAVLGAIDERGILRVSKAPSVAPTRTKAPPAPGVEEARQPIDRARAFEQRHDWAGAEAAYGEALDVLPRSETGIRVDVLERRALSSFRLAFQADSRDAFLKRATDALRGYGEALEACVRLPGASGGRKARCAAMLAYGRYWLTTDAETKRAEVAEVRRLTSEALGAFEAANESLEYGRTFNELHFGIFQTCMYQETREAASEIKDRLVEWGERSIELLSQAGDPVELARAYVITAVYQQLRGAHVPDRRAETHRRALECWRRALRISESEAYGALRSGPSLWGSGTPEAAEVYEKAFDQARQWKDVLGMAYAHDNLQYHLVWEALGLEDVDAQIDRYKKALSHALQEKGLFEVLGHERLYIGGFNSIDPLPEYLWFLSELETDPEKKRELIERIRDAAPDLLARAEASRAPRLLAAELSFVGRAYAALSGLEARPDRRERLLRDALEHAERAVAVAEPVETFAYNLGGYHDDLAKVLWELAELSVEADTTLAYMRRAISEKERGVRLYTEGEALFEPQGDPGGVAELGRAWYDLGRLYVRLADQLGDRDPLRKAVPAFEEAVTWYGKLQLSSRIAECRWRVAQTHDRLGEHMEAAESFRRASEEYNVAASRIPALKATSQDHAFLMEAWAEIEEGRARHLRLDYGRARENFDRSAILHRASRRWAYLAPNYLAWARLEEAEDESRREKSPEAVRAFREASRLFNETGRSLRGRRKDIEDPEEDRLVTRLSEAAVLREKYCRARIAFEEGRTLDESGDSAAAAEKYRLATEQFDTLLQGLESEEDRRDVGLILALSKASHRMARAESTGSAEDYRDAAALFGEAAELSGEERSRMVARGHADLCRAWDAGTRFLDTRDPGAYATALESLQGAEDCYRRAGVDRSATHAKASRILFDAWNRLEEADRARGPEEKARGYKAAESMLRAAATGLGKTGHTRLRGKVAGLLRRIGKEREMAVSLAEVLRAPAMAVSTSAFSAPAQTHERSTGLDSIEHADLQAILVARRKAVRLTEPLLLRMELVNAGRDAARLLRIEDLVPEGFELVRGPGGHAVYRRGLDLKGRRLEPLQSEAVRLTLMSRNEGTFRIAPRVLYLDESGNSKLCRPVPLEITISRLARPARHRSSRRP